MGLVKTSKKWLKKPRIITIKVRWVIVAMVLINAYSHHPSRIIYADPPLKSMAVQAIKPIPMPELATQTPLEPIFISKLRDYLTYTNSYDPGQCTWYTASRLPVPNSWGNAINWGYAAAAAGYTISDTPKAGAVAWSVTDSYLGHVAVVENDGVTISEMNYNGPYSMDSRIPSPGEFRYIYL